MHIYSPRSSKQQSNHSTNKHRTYRQAAFSFIEVMISISIIATALMAMIGLIYPLSRAGQDLKERERAAEIASLVIERLQGANWTNLGREPITWHRNQLAAADNTRLWVEDLNAVPDETTNDFKHHPMVDEPLTVSTVNLYDYLDTPASHGGTGDRVKLVDLPSDNYGLPLIDDEQSDPYGLEVEDPGSIGHTFPNNIVTKYLPAERYNYLQFLGVLDGQSGLQNLQVFVEYYTIDLMAASAKKSEWETNRLKSEYQHDQSHYKLNFPNMSGMTENAVIVRVLVTWNGQHTDAEREHEIIMARRQ